VLLPTQKTTSLESVFCWHTVGNAVCIALCCFQDRRLHYLNQSAVAIHSTTLLVLLCVTSNTEDYVLRVSLLLACSRECCLYWYFQQCCLYCPVLLPRQKTTVYCPSTLTMLLVFSCAAYFSICRVLCDIFGPKWTLPLRNLTLIPIRKTHYHQHGGCESTY
jgi:hypothetical protein